MSVVGAGGGDGGVGKEVVGGGRSLHLLSGGVGCVVGAGAGGGGGGCGGSV